MLFLSTESWIVGIIRVIYVLWGWIWGIFLIYQGKKTKAKLLTIWGIYTLMVHATYLGAAVDFLNILITGHNLNGVVYILLGAPWVGFNALPYLLVLTKLLTPNNKWFFISSTMIAVAFYEVSLFLNPLAFVYVEFPITPGEEIINDFYFGPVGNYMLYILNFAALLVGFGLVYKGVQSEGIIRKKYIYFAFTMFLYFIPPIFDAIIYIPIFLLPIVNSLQLVGVVFAYLGLRQEPEKRKKKIKKEVKVKDSLFRITQRPDQITEEEVTYYREQKICLICKGKVGGFNTYICMNCEALYHEDCALKLSDLENACWVCNQPIDETKPTKPFKIIEEKITGEVLVKEDKKLKANNKNSHKEG